MIRVFGTASKPGSGAVTEVRGVVGARSSTQQHFAWQPASLRANGVLAGLAV